VEIVAIPGGQALLAVVGVLFRNVDSASDGIGFADAINAAALWHGIAKGHHARTAGNAVFGINVAGIFARRRAIGEDEASRQDGHAPCRPQNRI
jgi:hypothetical protein